jgi:hypothetical protein
LHFPQLINQIKPAPIANGSKAGISGVVTGNVVFNPFAAISSIAA